MPSFDYENKIKNNRSISLIAGIDEVGRGALAGPIVAAAVIFDKYEEITPHISDVEDSKKISASKRNHLSEVIKKYAVDYSIGAVESSEIDKIGIGAANVLAFRRAIDGLKKCEFALIDGRKFRGFETPYLCLEKGESKSFSVAAASIIAKVHRDLLMQDIHEEVFRYDFASNKGYGSENHIKALEKHGPSQYHRKSFLLNIRKNIDQQRLF